VSGNDKELLMILNSIKQLPKSTWKVLLAIICIIIIILIAYGIAAYLDYYKQLGQDFLGFWLAPQLLLQGKNPYLPNDWMSAYKIEGANWFNFDTYLYPLPFAVLMIPLGLLPLEVAAIIWISLGIISILFTGRVILILIKPSHWPKSYLIPIYVGVFLLRSAVETIRIGQIDWLILLFLALGLYYFEKQHWLLGGVYIALSMIKPQIGVPLILFLSFWLLMRKKWLGIIGEGILMLFLYVLGWLFNHSWLIQWLEMGGKKLESSFCCTPTLWGLSSLFCNFDMSCGLIVGAVIALLACALLFLLLTQIPNNKANIALGLSIPVALLVSPYLWTYSQIILLIPILIIVVILKEEHFPYLLTTPFPLYMALFSAGIVFVSMRIGVDVITSLVPIVVFTTLLLSYLNYHRSK
jgi:hypothetical protein